MTDKEIHEKIIEINKKIDNIQSSINFYAKQFCDLEDKIEYYSKHSWLPDAKQQIKSTIHQMKEVQRRTEIEQEYFSEIEKQLDEIDNIL